MRKVERVAKSNLKSCRQGDMLAIQSSLSRPITFRADRIREGLVDTQQAKLIQYNMTVVFRELKFGQVLYELARELLQGYPAPVITEIPNQMLAVVYPDKKLQCQFANRRVDIRDNRGGLPGSDPFGSVAVRAVEAASTAGASDIVAYGYNYNIHLPLGSDSGEFIRNRFFKTPGELGRAFEGEVGDVGIKASIQLQDCMANFDIEPVPDQKGLLHAHVNYHYQSIPPTGPDALVEEIRQKYDDFKVAVERL